jgi:dihydrofolate reductase
MGTLIVSMQVTVDGFVDAQSPDADWQVWDWTGRPTWDPELTADFNAMFDTVGTILLSRPMVEEGYLDHWAATARSYPDDPALAFARRIGELDKVVISRQRLDPPWPRTTAIQAPLPDAVRALRERSDGDLLAFGGVRFVAGLAAAGLVDEFRFSVNPTAVGSGRRVLAPGTRLRLLEARGYRCGVVRARYAPADRPAGDRAAVDSGAAGPAR